MSRRWRRPARCVGLLLLLAAGVQAAEPPSATAERRQIKAERAAAEARYQQAEADCRKRFVVSSCVAEAQAQRRETLSSLRMRELALDETKRKAEAEESARRLEAKRAEAASKPPPVPRAASAPASAASSAAARHTPSERARQRSKTADDATAAAARATAQQRRASDAAKHRQEVEQRNAERDAHGKKKLAPLPVPSAASVAETASAASR